MRIPQSVLSSRRCYKEHEYESLWETIRTPERAKKNRNLAFKEIERLVERLRLDEKVKKKAMELFDSSLDTDLIQRYSAAILAATSVYMACRDTQTPRSLADFYRLHDVRVESNGEEWIKQLTDRKEIDRAYRQLKDSLGRSYPSISPEIFAERYCKQLYVGNEIRETAQVALKVIDRTILSEGPSGSIGAGAVLYATETTGGNIPHQDVSRVSNYTTKTIRGRKNEIEEKLRT